MKQCEHGVDRATDFCHDGCGPYAYPGGDPEKPVMGVWVVQRGDAADYDEVHSLVVLAETRLQALAEARKRVKKQCGRDIEFERDVKVRRIVLGDRPRVIHTHIHFG